MDQGVNKYVECSLCGRCFKQITETHLRKCHGISFAEYKSQFPDSETLARESRKKISDNAVELNKKGIIGFKDRHRINEGKTPWNKNKHGVQTIWSKGRTKENCESLAKAGKTLSRVRKEMFKNGKLKPLCGKNNPMFGTKLSDEHKLALLKGNISFNSKPELKLWKLIKPFEGWEYSAQTKYCIKLGNRIKNPDFVNRSKRKTIEVYGDYWHRNDNPQELINIYNSNGWECLVLWEHEIMDNNFSIDTIKEYIGG